MAELVKDKNAPRKKRPASAALLCSLVVIAVRGRRPAIFIWRYLNTYETTDDAQIDGHINAISGRITGNVIEVLAEDEQVVKAGDVLVRIDPRDYEVAVAKAEADLRDAEAALESSRIDIPITTTNTASQLKTANSSRADAAAFVLGAQRQLSAARDRLESAQAQVREAQANVKKTSDDVARYKLLVDKNEIPRQQYDTAVADAAARRPRSMRAMRRFAKRSRTSWWRRARWIRPISASPQADASIESAMTAPKQVAGQRSAREIRHGAGRAEEGAARPSQAESQLLHDRRAGHRDRRQENRGAGTEHFAGPAIDGGGSARRYLGHREFQGNAVEPHEPGPAGPLQRGCVRQGIQRQNRGCRRRQRFAIQSAASGKRHRELRESGAAHSGSHQSRPRPERRSPAAPRHVGGSEGLSSSRSAHGGSGRRSGNRNSIPG